jgi:uncharacterized protein
MVHGSLHPVVQTLFDYARSQFKDLKTYFFHNTIYDTLWEDPSRYKKAQKVDRFRPHGSGNPLILVGDASMAPYELMARDGSIYAQSAAASRASTGCSFWPDTFPHSVWLNPVPDAAVALHPHHHRPSVRIFPMFELTLDGLERWGTGKSRGPSHGVDRAGEWVALHCK